MTDAPTPREVLADALYKAVVQPELTWWDDLTPEMQEGWLRAADYALTRREPLDVERLFDSERFRMAVDATFAAPGEFGPAKGYYGEATGHFIEMLRAEYARLEAADAGGDR